MKFCTKCGRQAENDAQKFCSGCGAPFVNNANVTPPGGVGNGSGMPPGGVGNGNNMPPIGMNNNNGAYPNGNPYYNGQPPYGQQLPMKWYNFLIYFALFASALGSVVGGILYLTGKIYDVQAGRNGISEFIYYIYGGLKAMDIIYGIVALGLAALCIFVRQQLAHYKKDAPHQLLIMYGISYGVSIVYTIIQMIIVHDSSIASSGVISIISSIIGAAVLIPLNNVYFKKRAHLFRN